MDYTLKDVAKNIHEIFSGVTDLDQHHITKLSGTAFFVSSSNKFCENSCIVTLYF
jgi:hypothetical protein